MRKRRRTKYEWLLNTGSVGPAADVNDTVNGRDFGAIALNQNGTTSLAIVDLLNDTPSEDTALATSLSMGATTQNEYFVKRIVGKFFIAVDDNNSSTSAPAALVGAGIFIARAGDPNDGAGAENLPIGGFALAQAIDNYNPLGEDNIREPWIWRRTWVLSNPKRAGGIGQEKFPQTNAGYGSIQDGPHVDAKTARRVRDGERLFGVVACRNFPLNFVATVSSQVTAYFDYRVLGAMRKGHNRSAF